MWLLTVNNLTMLQLTNGVRTWHAVMWFEAGLKGNDYDTLLHFVT